MQPQNLSESLEFYHYLAGNSIADVFLPANYDFPLMNNYSQSFCSNSSFYPPEISDVIDGNPRLELLLLLSSIKNPNGDVGERINSHLDRLRTLLPCNAKTDKASLLAKVVQRVKELKQQTSEIMQLETFPSETDEITVLTSDNSNDGRLLIKASLCCEDRSDLIPDLIEILKSLHFSPMRAEMVTLGGRIRNVIVLACDKDHTDESVPVLRDALRSLVQRSNYGSGDRPKRRRVFDQGIVS